jgi:hypothetical protein
MQLTTWIPLRYWRYGNGKFGDSFLILSWSDCYKEIGLEVYNINNGSCSGYIYGRPLLAILSRSGLDATDAEFFGYLFMLLISVSLGFILKNLMFVQKTFVAILIIASPPLMLLIERANFDSIMFILILISALTFYKGYENISLFPLALASVIKFYTLPIFLLYFFFSRNLQNRIFLLIFTVISGTSIYLDLSRIKSPFPSSGHGMFGMSIWGRYLEQPAPNHVLSENLNHLLGLIIFVVFVIIFLKYKKINLSLNNSNSIPDSAYKFCFMIFFTVHLSCFCLGMSNDYRIIYLLFTTMFFLSAIDSSFNLSRINIWLTLIILFLWLSYPSDGLQPIGDVIIEVITIFFGVTFIRFCKNYKNFPLRYTNHSKLNK